jgi:hypothetical protein
VILFWGCQKRKETNVFLRIHISLQFVLKVLKILKYILNPTGYILLYQVLKFNIIYSQIQPKCMHNSWIIIIYLFIPFIYFGVTAVLSGSTSKGVSSRYTCTWVCNKLIILSQVAMFKLVGSLKIISMSLHQSYTYCIIADGYICQ